jgi:hypothetical protein
LSTSRPAEIPTGDVIGFRTDPVSSKDGRDMTGHSEERLLYYSCGVHANDETWTMLRKMRIRHNEDERGNDERACRESEKERERERGKL